MYVHLHDFGYLDTWAQLWASSWLSSAGALICCPSQHGQEREGAAQREAEIAAAPTVPVADEIETCSAIIPDVEIHEKVLR